MSKKETEFDRVDRMKKLEREAEMEKRKSDDSFSKSKKGGRSKPFITSNKNEKSLYTEEYEEEYDYIKI